MFCKNCGNKNDDNAIYCANCGTKLKSDIKNTCYTKSDTDIKKNKVAIYEDGVYKCPFCGTVIQSFESVCPNCNNEIRSSKVSSSIKDFSRKLQALEEKRIIKNDKKTVAKILGFGAKQEDVNKQVVNFIKNYVVPNNIEDLIEFLILTCGNIDVNLANNLNPMDINDEDELNNLMEINKAWISKAKQIYQKASISAKNHPKFDDIKKIYFEKINTIEQTKSDIEKHKKNIVKKGIIKVVVFILILGLIVAVVYKSSEKFCNIQNSSYDYIGKNYKDVVLELEDVGFEKISKKEVEILPTDTSKNNGEILQISINGITTFDAQTEFSTRSKIEITYYVVKYTITIHVDSTPNLIFSKYDVNLEVNEVKKGKIKNGTNVDLVFRIASGKNKLIFSKDGESDVNGSIEIIVNEDTEISLQISSTKKEINVINNTK